MKLNNSTNKMEAYIHHLAKDEVFLKKVNKIRKKYNIDISKFEEEKDSKKLSEMVGKSYSILEDIPDLEKDIDELFEEYEFGFGWDTTITTYVLTGMFLLNPFFATEIQVTDLKQEFEDVQQKDQKTLGVIFSETMPICIQFTPYTTERDLIDFIKKHFKTTIQRQQNKYKKEGSLIGNTRKRNTSIFERDQFIYENKDLNIQELTRLVNEKYKKTYDYTYIQKIIRGEVKKRK